MSLVSLAQPAAFNQSFCSSTHSVWGRGGFSSSCVEGSKCSSSLNIPKSYFNTATMTRYLAGPGPDDSDDTRVPLILGVTISLFAASFLVWLLRMYTRCRPVRRLSWDDLFISV